jgi:hypothetical protein
MSSTNTVSSPPGRFSRVLSTLMMLIINVVIPYICYTILKSYHATDVVALSLAAVVPTIATLVGVLRSGHLNIISLFILGGLVVGILMTFLGGDTRLLLIRESFFTGALGITCFVSLLFPRPLMFAFGRSLAAGDDPVKIAHYNQSWQNPYTRHASRVATIVWGTVYSSDLLLRVLLVFTLPTAMVVAAGPIVTSALVGVTMLWSFAYMRRTRQRVLAMQADSALVAR